MKPFVSIVIPVYNAQKFIVETLNSVKNQTYQNIEVILVDDMSKDQSCSIIEKYQEENKQMNITLIRSNKKLKAAGARNKGIDQAKGSHICFLDADDLWEKDKIEKQLAFMKEKSCAFSFTGYEFADSNGKPLNKKVFVPPHMTYKQALKNTTIWTTTVMFDMSKITKEQIYMPEVKSEDTACWWNILKQGYTAYGLNEVLAYYRRSSGTLSSNKVEALRRIWNLYRNVEHLNVFYSMYNFIFYAINAIKRRI